MNIDEQDPKDPTQTSFGNPSEYHFTAYGDLTPGGSLIAPEKGLITERLSHALLNFTGNDTIEFSRDVAFENGYLEESLTGRPVPGRLNYRPWGTNEHCHGSLLVGRMQKISLSEDSFSVSVEGLKWRFNGEWHECEQPKATLRMKLDDSTTVQFREGRIELMVVSSFISSKFEGARIPGKPLRHEASGYVLFGKKGSGMD